MRLRAIVLAILAVMLAPAVASAVETYSSTRFRKVVAEAVVPDRNSEQLYFSIVASTFWANEIHRWAPADGIYYQFAGTVDLETNGRIKTLRPGDGIFLAAGTRFTVRSSGSPPSPAYLQFLLSPTPEATGSETADGSSIELYRSPTPIPGLTHERNQLSLTRVPVPPQSPPDPPHRRTGAALHYVLSGAGAEFADGRAVVREPGSISYEPAGYGYQWSNPNVQPLVYLLFNVNPNGVEPVVAMNQHPEDSFERDPHLTLAMYCIAISMILMLVVSSSSIADYHRGRRARADRDDDHQ